MKRVARKQNAYKTTKVAIKGDKTTLREPNSYGE